MAKTAELEEWVEKAAAGDLAAMESLLIHFHDPLLLYIRTCVSEDRFVLASPEDVLQEAMVEAFRAMGKLQAQGLDGFFSFLKTIARNCLLDMIKSDRRKKRGGGMRRIIARSDASSTATSILSQIASSDPTPSRIVHKKEAIQAVAMELARLDPAVQEVIDLRFGQGLTPEEVSRRVGKRVGAVKMIIHRANKHLRCMLATNFGEI